MAEQEDIEINKNIFTSIVNKPQKIYDIYIYHPISNPASLIPYVEILRAAKEDDIVKLHIDSTDGTLDAFLILYNHILMCEGTVVTYVTRAASYGSLIALSGHVIKFLPFSMLELSMSSLNKGIGFGKGNDKEEKILLGIINGICSRILKPAELTKFKEGQTFLFDTLEAENRINDKQKHKKGKRK